MTKILNINSSVRNSDSISRKVTGEFLAKWKAKEPNTVIVDRDLAANPLPHLNEQTLGAFLRLQNSARLSRLKSPSCRKR